jgi:hypothetical protein
MINTSKIRVAPSLGYFIYFRLMWRLDESIDHRRAMLVSRESNHPHCKRTLYVKGHSHGVFNCYSEPRLVLLQYTIYDKKYL